MNLHPQLFADDANIASLGMSNLDTALEVCESWVEKNEMQINKKKSKILFMEGQMKYNVRELEYNKEYKGYGIALQYKSLGVMLQRNRLYNKHLKNITIKAKANNRLIGFLKRYNANQALLLSI